MVFETETTVNMNSLVSLLVLNRVTFSTGDQELATFAAGEKGFSFGEEGMLLLTSLALRGYTCTYVTPQLRSGIDVRTVRLLCYISGASNGC